MQIRIAQTSPDTDAEGPGRRYALWVQGCPIRCPGCCNPEMFGATGGTARTIDDVVSEILATPEIEGVTFLGGEPFEQAAALAAIAEGVRDADLSVVVFSGYLLEELQQRPEPGVAALLSQIDLLVDGQYDASQPEDTRRWAGSKNQRFHFFTDRYSMLQAQFWSSNTVEIRFDGESITVNGWPYESDLLFSRKTRAEGLRAVRREAEG